MNREFEFKQLMRAFRNGIISETLFETEMKALENGGAMSNGRSSGSFEAFGRSYTSERAAIISFLDKVRAGEANGGEAFSAWEKVCTTDCIRTGLRVIAERESYHARVFAHRLHELGGESRETTSEEGRKFTAFLGDAKIPDNEKLLKLTALFKAPEQAVQPICDFVALIKEDMGTKEALRLFSEDELSTTKWIFESCSALNAPASGASKSANGAAKSMSM
ncbi:MAG TPA: hypothetical protein VIX59_00825 [Candidatus Binataceae bacterium]